MKKFITLILLIVVTAAYAQKATNYWNGNFNSYWHNNNNWSLGHIPTSTEDVVIPNGMPRYPYVGSSNESIKSLTIYSAAYVRIGAYALNVSGDVIVYGEIDMDNPAADLYCTNLTWESGSTAQTTGDCEFILYGTWDFKAGANVQLNNGRVRFNGSANQYIRSRDADCYFNNVYPVKTGGVFGLSAQSTATCKIKGYLILGGTNYNFTSPSGQTIQIGNYFNNGNASINMVLDNGTIEFTGNTTHCTFYPQPGDYFNNLIINTGSYDLVMNTINTTSFEIKNDVTINSGRFDVNGMDLIVGGDWTNNVGSVGFWERDRKVTFNGTTHQYCSDEVFNILEINKTAGALRMSGSDVECQYYDWTDGAIDVLSGSFTANELVDAGIAGSWYVNDEVHIHQTDSYVDLLGDVHIFDGGYMHVYGGNDDSYWPYGPAGSEIEIESGGNLQFHDVGIYVRSSGTLTSNISGGWIGMIGDFRVDRADFSSPGAIWAMLGTTDAQVEISQGMINQLDIDKSTSKTGIPTQQHTHQVQNSNSTNPIIIDPHR